MEFYEKIRKLRTEKGWTQEVASKKIGIGKNTLKNYENKKISRIPATDYLKKIAKAYNVSTEYLLDDECINKTNKNIEIGKELSFSDETIAKIKSINQSISNETVGELIRGTSKQKFWDKLDKYISLSKYINALLPFKENTALKELLYKYSTNEDFDDEKYLIYEDEYSGTIDVKGFYKQNVCNYTDIDKEKILQQIDDFISIFPNEEIEFTDGEKYSYFDCHFDSIDRTVKKCINNKSYIPKSIINKFWRIAENEINSSIKEMEFLSFHISKEFNLFLNNYIL